MHYIAGSIGVCVSGCTLIILAYRELTRLERDKCLYYWRLALLYSVLGFGFVVANLYVPFFGASTLLTLSLGSLPLVSDPIPVTAVHRSCPPRVLFNPREYSMMLLGRMQTRAGLFACYSPLYGWFYTESYKGGDGDSVQIPRRALDGGLTIFPNDSFPDAVEPELVHWNHILYTDSLEDISIYTLLRMLYEKSHETEEHAMRLQELALRIADRLILSASQISDLQLLCNLHDTGKIGIPGYILNKPGELNSQEWDVMKSHAHMGARIIHANAHARHISPYILTHHERWDGHGYPKGLKGTEISLLCRILSVVDAYDAMTNDRCYRKAISHREAVAEIAANAGTQFDPAIVDIFLSVVEEPSDRRKRFALN